MYLLPSGGSVPAALEAVEDVRGNSVGDHWQVERLQLFSSVVTISLPYLYSTPAALWWLIRTTGLRRGAVAVFVLLTPPSDSSALSRSKAETADCV